MRTQRLAAWPPLAPEQVPSFPTLLRDGWRLKELPLGQDRRYWPIDDPIRVPPATPEQGAQWRRDTQRFLDHVRGVPLRPIQRQAVEEACAADGFFVGVGR